MPAKPSGPRPIAIVRPAVHSQPSSRRTADAGVLKQVLRSTLRFADYNPRVIDPIAARSLRESIKETGGILAGSVSFNARTGNVVGGHQRLSQEDVLKGYVPGSPDTDYWITVCEVDVPLAEEQALNVRLNNTLLQGEFDPAKLLPLLVGQYSNQLDSLLPETGFDISSLEALCMDWGVKPPDWFGSAPTADEQRTYSEIDQMQTELQGEKRYQQQADEIERMQQAKQDFREKTEREGNPLFSCLLVFTSTEKRNELFARLGLHPGQDYIDGDRILSFIEEVSNARPQEN
jgi:hypothetical protein